MSERPVVLITGASQGIGASTAEEFARRGYNTALLARNRQNLEAVAEAVRSHGGEASVYDGDLADLEYAENTVEQCANDLGRIDVLVNNAAWREIIPLTKITVESWERTLRIMLTTPAFLARWCAPHMERIGKGVIINISSLQSRRVSGFATQYMVAKGGMDSLTLDLAALYGSRGIRTVGLNLGAIDTAMSGDYETEETEGVARYMRKYSEDMIPLGRWGTPEEIGRCIAMFASDDASYVNGANIVIDGGWTHCLWPHSFKKMMFPEDFK